MASSTSITTSFIYSESQSKFPNSLLQPRIHSRNKHLSLSLQPAKVRAALLPVCAFSRTPCTPSSSFSPRRSLSKFISEKIAFFLIGSFILMGCFSKRDAFAVAVPSVGSAGVLVEKKKPVERKSEEEEMYEKILEKDPGNVEALKMIVHGKIRRGESKEAVKFVKRLIGVEPNEVEWWLLLALCYDRMGHLSKAKSLYSQILVKRPLLVKALHGLAMAMHENDEGPAVFEMLNKARELASNENKVTEERNIRILAAQMLVIQGDLEEGLKQFQDLIDQDPRDFRPYLYQGIIYSLLDKKEEAAQQFETYQALVPEEFPQREFLDDIALAATRTTRVQFQKEFSKRK